jgi:RNA polymerase-binding transcription factor DksA
MKDTHEFKTHLEQERKVLMEELGNLGIMNPKDKDWEAVPPPVDIGEDSDENDMADRFQSYEERTATLNTLQKRLTDVNDALAKIEKGTYGICEVSGEQIDIERLKANPAARTKIEFAEQ